MLRKIIFVVATYLTSLVMMALQKPLFLLWYAERSAEASMAELMGVSWHGLLLDSTTAAYISALPWLVVLLTVWIPLSDRAFQRGIKIYFAVMAMLVSLIVAIDMGLFRHWDFRLDSTILPYLKTPKEAAASLTWGDVWPTTILFVVYGAMLYGVWQLLPQIYRSERLSLKRRIGGSATMILCGGLLFLAIRGGLDTAPANVSKVYFSDNMFLNQAATNPIFSFLSSASRNELKEGDYRYFSDEECAEIFSTLQNVNGGATTPMLTTDRPNVVLIMLESLGRTVMDEVTDGKAVAPNLQCIKQEGIWFENIYANSYRTDRGTVAVMSGYPAHPIVSVMKYPQKAHTLPAIARTLNESGYATSFMYGGDANFTNTISYLYGTGVEQITDKAQMHFDAPTNKWGYADDVVCPYFTDEVLRLSAEEEPFFATLLTLSSHEPFDVPYDAFEDKILNSVAYTDQCVGEMIERWRESPEWEDMLVVLIADHGMPYPADLTTGSLARQRIPMIWTGGAIREGGIVVETFGSQSDLAATLLAQLGLPIEDMAFSKDIFNPSSPHYAFWSYNNAFGVIDADAHAVFDCTRQAVIDHSGTEDNIERLTRHGKAIIQTLHQDICRR